MTELTPGPLHDKWVSVVRAKGIWTLDYYKPYLARARQSAGTGQLPLVLTNGPTTWEDVVIIGRRDFEAHFGPLPVKESR